MPVPGRPRNPYGEQPNRFRGKAPLVVIVPGQSPGMQDAHRREPTTQSAEGTIRRTFRQKVNFIPASPPMPVSSSPPTITRGLRYRASSTYRQAGTDHTRFGAPRPAIQKSNRQPIPTLQAGRTQGRPTIRNRMVSFGSRVRPLNAASPAAQGAKS